MFIILDFYKLLEIVMGLMGEKLDTIGIFDLPHPTASTLPNVGLLWVGRGGMMMFYGPLSLV